MESFQREVQRNSRKNLEELRKW